MALDLSLLGGFAIRVAARPLTLPTRKTEAVLVCLALAAVPCQRDDLVRLLWPATDIEHGRNSLRQALSAIRAVLGVGSLNAGRGSIRLALPVTTDVGRFELLARSRDPARLRAAISLYRGGFLGGFTVPHAPAFQAWRLREDERLRALAMAAQQRLRAPHAREAGWHRAPPRPALIARRIEPEPPESAYRRALPHAQLVTRDSRDAALALLRPILRRGTGAAAERALAAELLGGTSQLQGWCTAADTEEAAGWARQAIADAPDDPVTLSHAGHVLLFHPPTRAAGRAATDRAMMLAPNLPLVAVRAGWAAHHHRQQDRALSLFERAIRLGPRDPQLPSALGGKAYTLFAAGLVEAALEPARAAVALAPWRGVWHRGLIWVLHELGRKTEALAARDHYVNALGPDAAVHADMVRRRQAVDAERRIANLRAVGLRE